MAYKLTPEEEEEIRRSAMEEATVDGNLYMKDYIKIWLKRRKKAFALLAAETRLKQKTRSEPKD